MKFSSFILVLFATFFSLNAWSYSNPRVVAKKTMGNDGVLDVTFRVYGTSSYPITSLSTVKIVAEITSDHNSFYQAQQWYSLNSGNASVVPDPTNPKIAEITGSINQAASRMDGFPEAEIMIVAGFDAGDCVNYGVRIISAEIGYYFNKNNHGTITASTQDDITQSGNCSGGSSDRIGNFDAPTESVSSLYPNPTQDQFFLSAPSNSRVQVSNLAGQLVYEASTSQEKEQISTTDWPAGIYLVRIYNEEKKKTEVLKLSVL